MTDQNAATVHALWQPIATAPRDGTFILTRVGPYRADVAFWGTYFGRTRWGFDPETYSSEEAFEKHWLNSTYAPTHWMPLPDEDSDDLISAAFEAGKREALAETSPALLLMKDAMAEAEKAIRKFPQPNYVISKVAEEAGEVVKAAIHCAEGREKPEAVIGEIRQAMAMLIRLYLEGDQVHGLAPLAEQTPKDTEGTGKHNDLFCV